MFVLQLFHLLRPSVSSFKMFSETLDSFSLQTSLSFDFATSFSKDWLVFLSYALQCIYIYKQ